MIDERQRYAPVRQIMLCLDSDKKRAIIQYLEDSGEAMQLKDIVEYVKTHHMAEKSTHHCFADIGQDCRYMTQLGLFTKISEPGKKGAYYQLNAEVLKIINLFTDKLNQQLQWEK